jgi:hypothetical protein
MLTLIYEIDVIGTPTQVWVRFIDTAKLVNELGVPKRLFVGRRHQA